MLFFPACVPPLLETQTECCPLLPSQGHLLSVFWSKFPRGTFFLFRQDSHLRFLQKSLLESSDLPQSGLETLDGWHAFIPVIISLCHPELSLLSFQMLDPVSLCRTPFPEFLSSFLLCFGGAHFSLPKKGCLRGELFLFFIF